MTGPLAWQGHPCIPAAAAQQVAPQPGKVVYVVGSLRGEDWFYPKVAFGSLANLMPMTEYLLCRDPATSEIVAGTGELAETWSVTTTTSPCSSSSCARASSSTTGGVS